MGLTSAQDATFFKTMVKEFEMMNENTVHQAYHLAQKYFAELDVDCEQALNILARIPVSLNCWQGDDVTGFENPDADLDGGLQATGNYPGRARTPDELRQDLDLALGLIPGTNRVNLHAIYLDTPGKRIDRNEIMPEHYTSWIDWAKERGLGLDFNGTFFSHAKAADGLTLTHPDHNVRRFWIEHAQACRRVGAAMGQKLGTPCVTNVWVPDGYKDTPADRRTPRERLRESLDEIFAEYFDSSHLIDAVESKLFGIGAESYTPGSHEFYLGYATANDTALCIDTGHFHPTELISDKLSAVLMWVKQLLLHVSRGVRWDSDHVVTLTEELQAIASELVRGDYLERVFIGLDYFDASINRIAAWVIGVRNIQKALLLALLEPPRIQENERTGDLTGRLALMEEHKAPPFEAVWNEYCLRQQVPPAADWLTSVREYEKNVLAER